MMKWFQNIQHVFIKCTFFALLFLARALLYKMVSANCCSCAIIFRPLVRLFDFLHPFVQLNAFTVTVLSRVGAIVIVMYVA